MRVSRRALAYSAPAKTPHRSGGRLPLKPAHSPKRERETARSPRPRPNPPQPLLQPLIKIVALVVHYDERRKIFHFNPPDCLHPEFRILQHLLLPNAVL